MLRTLRSFLKIGAIGFGGGSALIPVVEDEIVSRRGYLTAERYAEHNIVSNITPGALPVKLGMLSGHDIAGLSGMAAGAFAVALPGVLMTVLLLSLLSLLGDGAVRQIRFASVGISMFIIFLLVEYIARVLREAAQKEMGRLALLLMGAAALLTCGKEIRTLFARVAGESAFSAGTPLLDLSTIDVLVLAFAVIFFTGGIAAGRRGAAAVLLTVLYGLLFGDAHVLGISGGILYQAVLLIAATAVMLWDMKSRRAGGPAARIDVLAIGKKSTVFAAVMCVCFGLAFAFCGAAPTFLMDGAVSTVTSFGGGEAYITVADGIFVSSGMVESSVFYGQVIPVANALPGPILVKILAGVGYVMGFEESGMAGGYAMALLGFSVGVGCTCIACIFVDEVYHAYAELPVFSTLKAWILPVICGLLATTILSMAGEGLAVTAEAGLHPGLALLLMGGIYGLVVLLRKKCRINDLAVIFAAGALSVLVLDLCL